MYCEVVEVYLDKRLKEVFGVLGFGCGFVGFGVYMVFRVIVSSGGCGDGGLCDLLFWLFVLLLCVYDFFWFWSL